MNRLLILFTDIAVLILAYLVEQATRHHGKAYALNTPVYWACGGTIPLSGN